MDNMEHNRIGAVASGLKKYPIPGKMPPADCKIAAIQAKIDPKMSFLVFLCLLNIILDKRTSSEIGLKKYTFSPHSKWCICFHTLYLLFIRGGIFLRNGTDYQFI